MFFWFFIITSFTLLHKSALAASEFSVNRNVIYTFSENGNCSVSQYIKLTNNFSTIYPKEYQLTVFNHKIKNLRASDSIGDILKNTTETDGLTKIFLKFNNPSVNTQKTTDFEIHYTVENLATNLGNIWKIDIPKYSLDKNDQLNIEIQIPKLWGDLAYSSINLGSPQSKENFISYEVPKNLSTQNISLAFGQTQLFNFDLKYYLSNDQDESKTLSIPIPPETDTQTIIYTEINPTPLNIERDIDGNFLAKYLLLPKQTIDITVSGQAQIHPPDKTFPIEEPQSFHTLPGTYWPDNSTLKSYANSLKTPKKIYDFVVDTLNYDVNQINNAKRKDPNESLKNPSNSLCTDYTDLFISLCRLAKIPSREIQGYVFNQSYLQKNLNRDILHAWPQYWHQTKKIWQAVDPTWQETTNGTDYFNSIDLNRIIFVFHGQDSQNPLPPGSYKKNSADKSVFVSTSNELLNISTISPIIKFIQNKLIIFNPNLHALTNLKLSSQPYSYYQDIDIIPPLGQIELNSQNFKKINSLLPQNQNINFKITGKTNDFDQTVTNRYHLSYTIYSLTILGTAIICSIIIFIKKND